MSHRMTTLTFVLALIFAMTGCGDPGDVARVAPADPKEAAGTTTPASAKTSLKSSVQDVGQNKLSTSP